jgi:parallel beta-helix repeat protein
MTNRNFLSLLFFILFLFALVTPQLQASPNTIHVPGDYTTIQEAIDQANPGDTIQVSSGTYEETLFINKTLTLIGENRANTILQGADCDCAIIQANWTTVNISGFTIHNASNGIVLYRCSNSTITETKVNGTGTGIWLHYSHNNTVSDNLLPDNWCGVLLCGHSSNNTIIRNTIRDNSRGIRVTGEENFIVHNNFINNQNQTEMIESFHNAWNNTYEGNYWSNYNGTDTNQDGIGDTPYPIDDNNQDHHPLMGMYSQFKITQEAHPYILTTICNFTITNFHFTTAPKNAISFNVTGLPQAPGFCRITIPHTLLDGNYTVLIDNTTSTTQKELPRSNSTHTYLYFTYVHPPLVLPQPQTTGHVTIIPEFPATIILPSLIILSLIITILTKKLHHTH